MDKYFNVKLVGQTPNPQQVIWVSLHQCYCEGAAIDDKLPSEEKAGEYLVKHLLEGHRGHYSPIEAPQITFNVIGFSHRTMQQITRHRVAVHFSVQSFRYSGQRIARFGEKFSNNADLEKRLFKSSDLLDELERLIYLRPVGFYTDRQGDKYEYTKEWRDEDILYSAIACHRYAKGIQRGISEEHAAGLIPMDARQNWVMSANARSLMHILSVRGKKDAQLEIQQLSELILPYFKEWAPALYEWFMANLWLKARLAP